MSTVVNTVLSLSGWWAYAVVGLLAFGEAAAVVGLFLPGETALLLGGVRAATGHISLPLLLAVAVAAAVLGDSVGYEVGRHGGGPLRRSRLGRRIGEQRRARAELFVLRRGGPAVFLGRWVGVLPALAPALAGMTRMPYRRFLAWNLTGGSTWATTVVLAGYATGATWPTAAHHLGPVSPSSPSSPVSRCSAGRWSGATGALPVPSRCGPGWPRPPAAPTRSPSPGQPLPRRGHRAVPDRGEEAADNADPVGAEEDQQRDRGGHVQSHDEGQIRRLRRGDVQVGGPAPAQQGRQQHAPVRLGWAGNGSRPSRICCWSPVLAVDEKSQ